MKIDTEQVIATYKDRIFAIGLTMLKNPDDAEDVVQETFLRYHTYKKDFESKEHIESWLYKVAINKAKMVTLDKSLGIMKKLSTNSRL